MQYTAKHIKYNKERQNNNSDTYFFAYKIKSNLSYDQASCMNI